MRYEYKVIRGKLNSGLYLGGKPDNGRKDG
jgi:hypothetical protein